MTDPSALPVWGSPSASDNDRSADRDRVEPLVADAPPSWRLRREVKSDHQFQHEQLGIVTGTEQDAMDMLFEIAVEQAGVLTDPSTGYQIAREGTRLIVSAVKRARGEAYYQEHRFSAVQILTTVPPVDKPKR